MQVTVKESTTTPPTCTPVYFNCSWFMFVFWRRICRHWKFIEKVITLIMLSVSWEVKHNPRADSRFAPSQMEIASDTAKLTGPRTFANKRWVEPVKLLRIISLISPKSGQNPPWSGKSPKVFAVSVSLSGGKLRISLVISVPHGTGSSLVHTMACHLLTLYVLNFS